MRNFSKDNARERGGCFIPFRASTSEKRIPDYGKNSLSDWIKVGTYKYREQDLLGKGFSSKVYTATHLTNEAQKFAIKVIDLKKFKSSNLPMLDSEIKVHQALDHPNIVKCHDVYKTQQFYFIVMEYCPHGDLLELIGQKKNLQQEKAIQIIKQIIDGYKYLLYRGVLHRDLKPANIMKCENRWKIGDFGFSVFCKQEYLLDSINVGTPLYMPPESLRSNKYSPKTDIFALGVIMFQMLIGKTPWESKTEKQLLVKMQKEKISIPERIKSDKVIQFIEKACEVDEFKRLSKDNLDRIFQIKSQKNDSEKHTKKTNAPQMRKCPSSPKITITQYQQPKLQQPITPKKPLQLSTENSEDDSRNSLYSELYKKNTERIKFQLKFCHKIHQLVEINDFFLLQKNKKDFFVLTLLKHLLRSIKNMEDLKMNPFNLKKWETYRLSRQYLEIYSQIKLYAKKYEKEYLDHLKNTEISMIRGVNRKFPELSYTSTLNNNFYMYYKSYIVGVLRMHNHEVMKKKKEKEKEILSCPGRYYQALNSLYNYYIIIEDKCLNDYQKRNSEKSIKQLQAVLNNWQSSKVSQLDYQRLRENIKLL